MTEPILRAACPEDIHAIAQIEADIFSDAWSEAALRSHLESAHAYAAVLTDGISLFGYLLGTCLPAQDGCPAEGELYRIAVPCPARGHGYGTRLLTDFLAMLDACYLEVRESNAAARSLYEAHGFLAVGRRRAYYRNPTEDACLYCFSRKNEV